GTTGRAPPDRAHRVSNGLAPRLLTRSSLPRFVKESQSATCPRDPFENLAQPTCEIGVLGEIRRTGSSGLLETRRYDLTGSVELLGDLRRRGQRRTAVRTKFAHRSVTPSSALLPADHEERFTTTSPVRRHTEYLRSTTDNVDLSPVSHARFLLRSSSHAATRSPRVPRRPRRPRCPRRPAVRP